MRTEAIREQAEATKLLPKTVQAKLLAFHVEASSDGSPRESLKLPRGQCLSGWHVPDTTISPLYYTPKKSLDKFPNKTIKPKIQNPLALVPKTPHASSKFTSMNVSYQRDTQTASSLYRTPLTALYLH